MHISDVMTSWSSTWEAVRPTLGDDDRALNTLRYMFFVVRCGVYVAVQDSAVVCVVPFANAKYHNEWHTRVCASSLTRVTRASHGVAGALPDPSTWWLNASGVLCNVMPAGVWGTHFLDKLVAMVSAGCASLVARGRLNVCARIFMNKRDHPVLRKDGRNPFRDFVGDWRDSPTECHADPRRSHAPIFSFYSGPDMVDVPMPLPEDLDVAMTPRIPHVPPIDARSRVAVFRGSATGPVGPSNQRLALARLAIAHPHLLDVGITSTNTKRLRVWSADDGGIHIGTHAAVDLPGGPVALRVPLHIQVSTHAVVLYVDGHAAASRYSALMTCGAVMVVIESTPSVAATCGVSWAQGPCVPQYPGYPIDLDADHVRMALEDVVRGLEWLGTQPAATLQQWVANARARAPTQESIAGFWDDALDACHSVHDRRTFFSPSDRHYAAIPTPPIDIPPV